MKQHVITIPIGQSCAEIISCVDDSSYAIHCAAESIYNLVIEHKSGLVECAIYLDRNSKASIVFVGNNTSQGAVVCSINAESIGSQASVIGLYDIQDSQSISLQTKQFHNATHTTSHVHMRKVVRDHASSLYNGMIHITKEAAHTDASQTDLTLLMGDDARAESVPSIEVKTHDVQCKHGSAIGRLDDHQLAYMQARGLSIQQATTLLLHGFFVAALDTIEHDELRMHAALYMGLQNESISR